MKRVLILLLLGLVACAPQDDNPLIAASDDQFVEAIGILPFLGCEIVLFGQASGSPGSETQRSRANAACRSERADAGIPKAVTSAHLADHRVKARYDKLIKRK